MKKIVHIRTMNTVGLIKLRLETGEYFFAKLNFISCDKDGKISESTVDHQRHIKRGEFDFTHAERTHLFMRVGEIEKIIESLEKHAV